MKGDTRNFLSFVLGGEQAAWTTGELFKIYCAETGREENDKAKTLFRGMMGRIAEQELAVSLFRGSWVFPDSEAMVRLFDHPEAPRIILSEGLRGVGYLSHTGGFEILYENQDITVPPRRAVIFSTCTSLIDVKAALVRRSGNGIYLDMAVVPRGNAGTGEGLEVRTSGKFSGLFSTPSRAREEAYWLARSVWGARTGISGQECLLLEMDRENETCDLSQFR